jgi:hypothetical protein
VGVFHDRFFGSVVFSMTGFMIIAAAAAAFT